MVYEVFADELEFGAMDAICVSLSTGPYSYRSYLGTMRERVWSMRQEAVTRLNDVILERRTYDAERRIVAQGEGFDCNGNTVEFWVTEDVLDGTVKWVLCRRLGYCWHSGSRMYFLRRSLIDAWA